MYFSLFLLLIITVHFVHELHLFQFMPGIYSIVLIASTIHAFYILLIISCHFTSFMSMQ